MNQKSLVAQVWLSIWIAAVVTVPIPLLAAVSTKLVWGTLPLAGFQYYAGMKLWKELKQGDPLYLIREPEHPHDPNAIRVEWKGEKLGYVPRAGNAAIAKMMDKGIPVSGRIVHLHPGRSHWQRLMFDVIIEQ